MFNEKRSSMLHGVLLIALFSCAAFYIGEMSFVRSISFSPMIAGYADRCDYCGCDYLWRHLSW